MIIDDEPIAIQVIKKHLSSFHQFKVVGEFHNAIDAMGEMPHHAVDLIFCDIHMPHITGVEFVKSLRNSPKVIFTTAYRNYAIEAFDLNIVDYLLKPISVERFAQAINKFLELSASQARLDNANPPPVAGGKNYMVLKADKKHHKIDLSSIQYFESLGDYVVVHTSGKKLVVKEKISHIGGLVPENMFLRIHRSYIVSFDAIKAIGPGFVELEGIKLPIGRNYKPNLDSFF